MLWGLDNLGGAKYGKLAADKTPAGWIYGVFTNLVGFGDAMPSVKMAIKKGVVAGFRLNLSWSDTHNFDDRRWTQQIREARRWAPLIKANPSFLWYVSGATEHKLPANLATSLKNAVMQQLPNNAIYVNNPLRLPGQSGAFIPGVINEVHGAEAQVPSIGGQYAYSCDGSDCFDFDITEMKTRFVGAEYFMFWTSQCNGRLNANDPTPRPQRIAYPVPELMDAMVFLSTNEGTTSLPDRYLVKPKADQHTVPPEPRALKPVVIIPPKTSSIQFITLTGNTVVHSSSAPQEFVDGRWRYYFNEYGYKIAQKAMSLQAGDPRVRIRVNAKTYGPINPAFRIGEFR